MLRASAVRALRQRICQKTAQASSLPVRCLPLRRSMGSSAERMIRRNGKMEFIWPLKDPEMALEPKLNTSADAELTDELITADLRHFKTGGFCRNLILNRTEALNVLNLDMVRRLSGLLKKYELSDVITSVVLRQAGPGAFCAGVDLAAIAREGRHSSYPLTFYKELYRMVHLLAFMDTPVHAWMSGLTLGAGFGLVMHGKCRYATENSVVLMPECGYGFFPDVGSSHFLPRVPRAMGIYLALTGWRLRGCDLVHAGIATHYMDYGMTKRMEARLAENFSHRPSTHLALLREFGMAMEPYAMAPLADAIERCFSKTTLSGVIDALEMEGTEWSIKVLRHMRTLCPLSLVVTFQALQIGAQLGVQDCIEMEFRICQRFLKSDDYWEGLQARVVEKRTPTWSHARIEDVTAPEIRAFFEAQPGDEEPLFYRDMRDEQALRDQRRAAFQECVTQIALESGSELPDVADNTADTPITDADELLNEDDAPDVLDETENETENENENEPEVAFDMEEEEEVEEDRGRRGRGRSRVVEDEDDYNEFGYSRRKYALDSTPYRRDPQRPDNPYSVNALHMDPEDLH